MMTINELVSLLRHYRPDAQLQISTEDHWPIGLDIQGVLPRHVLRMGLPADPQVDSVGRPTLWASWLPGDDVILMAQLPPPPPPPPQAANG